MLVHLKQCAKNLLSRLSAAANQLFRSVTQPGRLKVLTGTLADLPRTRSELTAENALLRQQLIILERQVKHPTFTPFDRGLLVVLASP